MRVIRVRREDARRIRLYNRVRVIVEERGE